MKEMYKGMINSPVTELKESISAQSTVIKVNNINAFPAGPNLAVIGTDENAETIYYATKTTNALSGCQRGVEGIAKVWNAGEKIARNFTNKDHADLIDNINEVKQRADEAFQSASSGKQALATAITGKEIPASADDTFLVLADKVGRIKKATGNAQSDDVLSGKTFSNDNGTQVGTMTNRGAYNAQIGTSGQFYIPYGFHNGQGKVTVPTTAGRTIIPSTVQQTAIQAGRLATGNIVVAGDKNLVAGNIKNGISIYGVTGTLDTKPKYKDQLVITEANSQDEYSWQPVPNNNSSNPRLNLMFPVSRGIMLVAQLGYDYNLEAATESMIVKYGNGNYNKTMEITAEALLESYGIKWIAPIYIDELVDRLRIEYSVYYRTNGFKNIIRW